MKIADLIKISLILSFWAVIFLVLMPRACSQEIKNQDGLNAGYAFEYKQSLGADHE